MLAVPFAAFASFHLLPTPTPATWKLVEEWRVGGVADGALSFDATMGFGVLPNGNLVHYDYETNQVHYLSPKGVPLKTVGRTGSGPGESRDAYGIAITPTGTVVVNDLGNARFTRYDSQGKFIDVIARKSMGFSNGGGLWVAAFLTDGRLIERTPLIGAAGYDAATVQWTADLKGFQVLNPDKCNASYARDFAATHVALKRTNGQHFAYEVIRNASPTVPVAHDPGGFTWESPGLDSGKIVKRRIGSCTVEATINLSGSRVAFTAEDARMVQARLDYLVKLNEGLVVPAAGIVFPKTHPWYKGLRIDAVGNVWVGRETTEHGPVTEVYDSRGAKVATIDSYIPIGYDTIITRDHVYAIEKDTDGVAYLVSRRIQR